MKIWSKREKGFPCGSETDVRRRMHEWYGLHLGQLLLAAESRAIETLISDLFGYHLLEIGSLASNSSLCDGSRIPHKIRLEMEFAAGDTATGLYADAAALPLTSESVDLVVLPHILEFHSYPHQILREIDRVLIPEGHVVIVCFNPVSLWGLTHLVLSWRKRVPWCGKFRHQARIKDWLQLLGFDIVECSNVFYRPPLQHEKIMQRLAFMERLEKYDLPFANASTIMVAKKRTVTLTPVKPSWRTRRLVGSTAAEPTTRGMGRRHG